MQYVKERIYSDDQSFEDVDDESTILSFTVNNKYELLTFVRSFGWAATLLSPENLREELKNDLLESLSHYQ